MATHTTWIEETLPFFRRLGFFKNSQQLSNTELALHLEEKAKDSYWGCLEPSNDYHKDIHYYGELTLLTFDSDRVWFIEDALDYFKSPQDYFFEEKTLHYLPNYYEKVFLQLNHLAQGKISLTHKKAFLAENQNFLLLDIEINGHPKQLKFVADMGVLCLHFFAQLNEWIQETGYCFEYIMDGYGSTFVFFLSQKEKIAIVQQRQWEFSLHDYYWYKLSLDAAQEHQYKQAAAFAKKAYTIHASLRNAHDHFINLNYECEYEATAASQVDFCKAIGKAYLEEFKSLEEEWFYKNILTVYKKL